MYVINYWTNVNNFCIAQRLYMNMNTVKVVGFIPDNVKTDLKESKEIQGCRGSSYYNSGVGGESGQEVT